MVNSVAGGGTLLTFPTLLWLGMDPKVANATSTVALWPGSLGAAVGYRRELGTQKPLLRRLALPSLLGGGAGAALLLVTPSVVFERLVPWLILLATALFMAQEPIQRWLKRPTAGPPSRARAAATLAGHFAVAVYGGYFGAGMGIMVLAVLGLLGVEDIHAANGLKMVLGALINGVAVVSFAAAGIVAWPQALVMAAAAIAGGWGGAAIARWVGRVWVRRAVVAIGIAIGVVLLVRG